MEILTLLKEFALNNALMLVVIALLSLVVVRFGPRAMRWVRDDIATLVDPDAAERFDIGQRDDDPEIDLTDEIAADLGKLIEAGRWDLYHSLLAAWEKDRATTPFGTMFHRLGVERALWQFTEIEAAIEDTGLMPDDAQIDAIVAAFDGRAQADPDDHVAATLAARAHICAGWLARGDGYIEEVSANNLRRMTLHYEAAETLLAPHAPKRSSLVAEARYTVCLGLETGSTLIRDRYDEWVAIDPDDVAPFQVHGFHLLPRWFGDLAELEAEAQRAAEVTQPRRGAAGYVIFHGGIMSCDAQHETLGIVDPDLFVRSALDRARTAGSQWGVNRMAEFLMQAMLESRGDARETYRAGLRRLIEHHLQVLVPRAWSSPLDDVRRELAGLFRDELEAGSQVRIDARGLEILPPAPEDPVAA